MKISYNWLRQYIDLHISPEELAEKLTSIGLEVEELSRYSTLPEGIEQFVIGEVKEAVQHPNADRLRLTKVDVGGEKLQHIVCGAPNVAAGQKVAVALPGTVIRPVKGESFTIKASKIRGEVSEGMICAEDELGLGEDHEGILVLPSEAVIGKPLISILPGYEDFVIEVGLTPNRGDAASHLGMARDLSALLNKDLKHPEISLSIKSKDKPSVKIRIEDEEGCHRYSGLVMKGIKVGPSPEWLKNYLHAVGLHPINNIVDATNFVMFEMGHPLHAFDLAQVAEREIVIRKSKPGEKITTLDEQNRILDGTELLIADPEKPLALAGVFGGLESGINEDTREIFIESAWFNPQAIRKTVQRHQLHTDASFRFERGADPLITLWAALRATQIIKEIAGGEAGDFLYDVNPVPFKPAEIRLSFEKMNALAGTEIPKEEALAILKRMEFEVLNQNKEEILLKAPSFKSDVQRPVDVIEEVLRIYSINKIPVSNTVKSVLQVDKERKKEELKNAVSSFLAARGFHEAYLLNFESEPDSLALPHSGPFGKGQHTSAMGESPSEAVAVVNPLSADMSFLRADALQSGLKAIAYNLNRQQENVRLFEWGSTHQKTSDPVNPFSERRHLAIWAAGWQTTPNWYDKGRQVDFYYLKGMIEAVLQLCKLKNYSSEIIESADLDYGVQYTSQNQILGIVGKVAAKTLAKAGIEQDVYYADFDANLILTSFFHLPSSTYVPISRFPKMERDLALQVPSEVTYARLQKVVKALNNPLIKKLSLFDVYEGKQVKEGFKSYAIRLEFENPSKTLDDKTVDKIMQQLIHRLKDQLNIEVRA